MSLEMRLRVAVQFQGERREPLQQADQSALSPHFNISVWVSALAEELLEMPFSFCPLRFRRICASTDQYVRPVGVKAVPNALAECLLRRSVFPEQLALDYVLLPGLECLAGLDLKGGMPLGEEAPEPVVNARLCGSFEASERFEFIRLRTIAGSLRPARSSTGRVRCRPSGGRTGAPRRDHQTAQEG